MLTKLKASLVKCEGSGLRKQNKTSKQTNKKKTPRKQTSGGGRGEVETKGLEDMFFHNWNVLRPCTWVTHINNISHAPTCDVHLGLFSFISPWREPRPPPPPGGSIFCSMIDFEVIEIENTLNPSCVHLIYPKLIGSPVMPVRTAFVSSHQHSDTESAQALTPPVGNKCLTPENLGPTQGWEQPLLLAVYVY